MNYASMFTRATRTSFLTRVMVLRGFVYDDRGRLFYPDHYYYDHR